MGQNDEGWFENDNEEPSTECLGDMRECLACYDRLCNL